jgi:hypothetical protein
VVVKMGLLNLGNRFSLDDGEIVGCAIASPVGCRPLTTPVELESTGWGKCCHVCTLVCGVDVYAVSKPW